MCLDDGSSHFLFFHSTNQILCDKMGDVQTAWSRHMNFPPHGQPTQIQGVFGQLQRFMANTVIMHIFTNDAARYTLEICHKKTLSQGIWGMIQVHMKWCWKHWSPCLPPLSVLPFMTHDEAGKMLEKQPRRERRVKRRKQEWRMKFCMFSSSDNSTVHVLESNWN